MASLGRPTRRVLVVAAALGALGVGATVGVATLLHGREVRRQADVAQATAQAVAFALGEQLRLPAEAVQALASFLGVDGATLDQRRFAAIAEPMHARAPYIFAIEWAPVVPGPSRPEFEARAQRELRPDFAIREVGPSGALVAAAPRARYLPLLYAVPAIDAWGFDVWSRPEAAAVAYAACRTGSATASPRYQLVEDAAVTGAAADDAAAIIVYAPVWRRPPPLDGAARCAVVDGYAVLVVRIAHVVRDVTGGLGVAAGAVQIDDVTDPPGQLLYGGRGGRGGRTGLELLGRRWQVSVAAAPGEPMTRVWLVGLGLTALLTGGALIVGNLLALRRRLAAIGRLGQYQIERELGRGAMGVVYQARHLLMERTVALKLIRPDALDPLQRARFQREVTLTAKLSHPGVVAIHDVGMTDEGLMYYAMERLRGLTTHAVVAASGPLPVARVVHLAHQLAEALREAHRLGIIHRDVSPANVMLTVRGDTADVVKLLDFGLVKQVGPGLIDRAGRAGPPDHHVTGAGLVVGTPGFIAPEVLFGGEPKASADVFGLGAVMYLLLAGQPPFPGETPRARLDAQLAGPPPDLLALRPDLPGPLHELVVECMQPDPRLRIGSMAAVVERLEALASIIPEWTQDEARAWWKDRLPA
jgi:tRNA A-37 threonylcarbamoyl transferase component Bud32